jgi:two-component system, cell cycle sensor histidine kinase and response regulator CckA
MNSDTFLGLVNNAALLLALAVIYDTLPLRKIQQRRRRQLFIGLLIGFIGMAIMLTPWRLSDGVIFDTRSILLSLAAFFFGPVPALVAAGMTSALRLWQGGAGAITGVCVILTATGLGLAWRHLISARETEPRWYEFYAFGLIVHLATLLWFYLTLPSPLEVLRAVALPMIVIHPLGTILLGLLLTHQRQRNQWETALREERDLLARISETSLDAILLTAPDGTIQAANPAACRMFGRSEAEIMAIGRNGVVDTTDPRLPLALVERTQNGRFLGELTFIRKNGEKFPGEVASALFKDKTGQDRTSMIIRDITQRKQMEDAIFLMSETQTKIAQLNHIEDIFHLVGEKVQSLIRDGQTILTIVDQATETTRIVNMYGFGADFGQFTRSLGYEPAELRFPLLQMSDEEMQNFRGGQLQKFEGGLYNLLVRQVSEEVCAAIEAHLQISSIYTIGFNWEEVNYGGLVILARRELPPLQGMIETIVTQASIAIRRILTEEFLHESNEYRQTVFASLQDGISIVDRQGSHIEVNHSFCQMTGFTPEELIGAPPPHPYWPPEELENIQRAFTQTLAGDMATFELTFMRKNGERFPVIVSPSAIRNQQGEVIRYAATIKDISERKQSEQKLAESERRYRLLAEGMADVVWVLDVNSRQFTYISPSIQKLRGYTAEEVYAQPLEATLKPESLERIQRLMEERIATFISEGQTRAAYIDQVEQPHKNGHTVQTEINTTYLLNESGNLEIIGVSRDITERKRVEAQLQQQERLAAVGQLAAGIAHDFNNILAVIILYAQHLAESEDLPAHHRERLAVVNNQAWHASQLVEQILDFSRRAILEQRPLNIVPLFKEQVKLLNRTLPENIDITFSYRDGDYIVNADPTRIQQMLTNLVVNARDAMPNGGTLTIALDRLSVTADDPPPLPEMRPTDWIRITVSDTGTGIAEDALPHIFEPFFTTKEPGKGSGLGLAQVYGIIGQHGGHIGVKTEPEQGTTFAIYLPAFVEKPAAVSATPLVGTPKGNGELVLIVEDGTVLRTALRETLETLNYRVLEAGNGHEALAIMDALAEPVALVLSDVVMPGLGGIALLQSLRQNGWQTPVVLLTGHVMDEDHDDLLAEGVSAWLTKPPTLSQLAQAIAGAMGR